MVADAVQVVGNKLYVMGGGWDRLTVQKFPANQQVGIALAFKVPWVETNEKHSFEIEIATEDAETLQKIEGALEVGRPPGVKPGSDQRVQIGATASIQFKQPGQYLVIARIDGEDSGRAVFHVVGGNQTAVQGPPAQQPPQ